MSDSGPGGAPDATHLNSLLLRVANSDQAAFEALYQATANRLFAICLRLLRDRGEAEDVLQEVFTTVWHKAGQFDAGKAAAMTWMGMIARNRAIDRLRAGPARMALESIEVPEDLAADDDGQPQALAESASDRERLHDCLDTLEARRQALIRAAFFDGHSYEELARRIGSPLGSVKSWIRRGLGQLRMCLEQ